MSWILRPTLDETAAAIVAALASVTSSLTPRPDICEFQGSPEYFLKVAGNRLPALGVVYAGGTDDMQGVLGGTHKADWVVLLLTRNYRSQAAPRNTSAAGETGSRALMQLVRSGLTLNDLELDGLTPLEPQSVELLGAAEDKDASVSFYQLAFSATHEWAADDSEVNLETIQAETETPNSGGTWSVQGTDTIEVA